jgi:hypothetical protein
MFGIITENTAINLILSIIDNLLKAHQLSSAEYGDVWN